MYQDELDTVEQDPNAPDGQEEVNKQAAALQAQIAALEARAAEAERKERERAEQVNALLVQGLARPAQAAVVPEDDPFEGMDADLAKVLRNALKAQEGKYEARVSTLQQQVVAMQIEGQARSVAAEMGLNAEEQEVAATYARNLRAQGVPVNPKDTAILALGLAEQKRRASGGQQETAPRAHATATAVRSADITQQQRRTSPLPPNFDDLSPDQQLAIMKKRGADNIPL